MNAPVTLLLLARESAAIAVIETMEPRNDIRFVHALGVEEMVALVARDCPSVLVIGTEPGDDDPIAICRRVKSDPVFRSTVVLLAAHPGDRAFKERALLEGADDFVAAPIEAVDLAAKARFAAAAARSIARQAAAEGLAAAARRELSETHGQMEALLTALLETCRPGATDRGMKIAAYARTLADRFGIPEPLRADLEFAARFHEIGLLPGSPPVSEGAPEPWRTVHAAKQILGHVTGFQEAAEIVGIIYENWDGTGGPERLQQGQIPLRARILRVLIEIFHLLEADDRRTVDDALSELTAHAGTRYDPLVLVHLRAVLKNAPEGDLRGSSRMVAVSDLRPGMVLAEDLCTGAGMKLLARDTVLTSSTLAMILRRHRLEPIGSDAAIRRGMS